MLPLLVQGDLHPKWQCRDSDVHRSSADRAFCIEAVSVIDRPHVAFFNKQLRSALFLRTGRFHRPRHLPPSFFEHFHFFSFASADFVTAAVSLLLVTIVSVPHSGQET